MNAEGTEILASITPSAPRRIFATGVLGGLGVLLELLAFLRPPDSLTWQVFLIAMGVVALVACTRLHQATSRGLVLTRAGLRDTDGREVALLDDVRKVERGVFAFKPSNGFLLLLNERKPRAWAPGLWWRLGRRVGVGGVISGAEGRQMADLISAMIADERRGD